MAFSHLCFLKCLPARHLKSLPAGGEPFMKPLIGVTMNLDVQQTRNMNILDQDYGRAIYRAGGIPVPILGIQESISDLTKQLEGFVFTGGDDIHPRFYKEKRNPKAALTISPDDRTRFEINLLKAVYKENKPILAICCGEQLVNIAFGGTLFQDIPLQIPGAIKHGAARTGEKQFHHVDILSGTLLQRITGTSRILVRSAHHQSVKKLGTPFKCSARSSDGVIEAFELKEKGFLVAVQWHPEKTLHDRYAKKIFKAFINAAKK